MNYHLMNGDKFIDSYIEDVYELGDEKNNTFFIRGSKEENNLVKTNRQVTWIGNDLDRFAVELKKMLSASDKVFIHWFDFWAGKVVTALPSWTVVVVYPWGGDFFEDQSAYVFTKEKILDPHTKVLAVRQEALGSPRTFFHKLRHQLSLAKTYFLRLKQVWRIDYLVLPPFDFEDYRQMKSLFPTLHAKFALGFYDQNFDRSISQTTQAKSGDGLKIMVGNSAKFANNHIDAFLTLAKLDNISVYCPLSYGSKEYSDLVISKGKEIFGDRFYPVVEFMSRETYINFLNKIDVFYMAHNRSQAFGNIVSALSMGKVIFLKKRNALLPMFNAMGVKVFDCDEILTKSLKEFVVENEQHVASNRSILDQYLSNANRRALLKDVLNIPSKRVS